MTEKREEENDGKKGEGNDEKKGEGNDTNGQGKLPLWEGFR